MDQTQNNKNKKRNALLIPFLWLLGIGLTGGLVYMGSSLSKKGKQVAGLEQQLEQTSATLNGEKDSLLTELQQANNDYLALQTKNEILDASNNELKNKSNRLARQHNNLVEKQQQCDENYSKLLSSFDQLTGENTTLKNDLAAQRAAAASLQDQLLARDSQLNNQSNIILAQKEKQSADSIYSASVMDSIIHENSSHFVNITEFNGAYGLNIRDVPYAKYFYGITNVSGLYVNKHFISGLGVGVIAYNGGVTIPLYLDFRYHFNKRNFTPYIYADGGLLLKTDYLEEPILFINPGIGLYKSISDKFALNFGAGVFIQRDDAAKASFVNFKLGLIYKKGSK